MLLHLHGFYDSHNHLIDYLDGLFSLRGDVDDLRLLHLRCVDDVFVDLSLVRFCFVFLRILGCFTFTVQTTWVKLMIMSNTTVDPMSVNVGIVRFSIAPLLKSCFSMCKLRAASGPRSAPSLVCCLLRADCGSAASTANASAWGCNVVCEERSWHLNVIVFELRRCCVRCGLPYWLVQSLVPEVPFPKRLVLGNCLPLVMESGRPQSTNAGPIPRLINPVEMSTSWC